MSLTTTIPAGAAQAGPPTIGRPAWLRTRLSLLLFLAYAVQGAWVPVFAVTLKQRGFSPIAVAWAYVAYSLSSLVAPLLWGQLADRWLPAERCISLCALAAGALLAVMPYVDDLPGMFLACMTFWFFMIPVNSLGTALSFRQLEQPERSFGRIRLWGTVGWMVGGMVVTVWLGLLKPGMSGELAPAAPSAVLTDSFGVGALFAFILAGYSLTLPYTPPLAIAAALVSQSRMQRLFEAPLRSLRLVRQRGFFTYVVCLFGLHVTLPFSLQMTPLLLRHLGFGDEALPTVLTVMQSTEVAMLALLPWLLSRCGMRNTMILGAGAWTLGMAAYAIGAPTPLVVGAMTSHGIFICCFLVAGQVYANGCSPPDIRASTQGLLVLVGGAGQLAGHLLVGAVRTVTEDNLHLAFLPVAIGSGVLLLVFAWGFPRGPNT